MPTATEWVTDLLDLVLARACLVCDEPGRAWCAACLAGCPRDLLEVPLPGTKVPATAASRYDGPVREAVIAFKEHGNRALAPMLGTLLAEAVAGHAGAGGRVVLVPVPGHRRPARGFDSLGDIVRGARRALRAADVTAVAVPALRLAHDRGPIKRLDRAGRRAAVRGAMRADRGRTVARLRSLLDDGWPLVVVDDVVTTGGTVAEAVSALTDAGIEPAAVAAVARTDR